MSTKTVNIVVVLLLGSDLPLNRPSVSRPKSVGLSSGPSKTERRRSGHAWLDRDLRLGMPHHRFVRSPGSRRRPESERQLWTKRLRRSSVASILMSRRITPWHWTGAALGWAREPLRPPERDTSTYFRRFVSSAS